MKSLIRATAVVGLTLCVSIAGTAQFKNFITVRDDSLMDGNRALRFISFNIPTLVYVEDNYPFAQPNPWRTSDAFEIGDALESIRQLGGQVVRMYVPSVRKEIDDSTIVRHVLAPGEFNEDAFRAYDKMLELANKIGVRIIIPFVDNWWWWGGPKEYAGFRGKKAADFWTDSLMIADYKRTVAHLLTRVNSYTGISYKDDKAILCWETGNELECPTTWNVDVAAYIKSLDANHLVMAGSYEKLISEEYLADHNIDIVETHHYDRPDRILDYVTANRALAKSRKPYIVGEFGFIPTNDVRTLLDTVIANGTSGIMIWSMRQHNRDGGFYYHSNAYRWPGFVSGASWDEYRVDSLFHAKAFQIKGELPTPLPVPASPRLIPIETPFKISWQGSAGASSYVLERKAEPDTVWKVIAEGVSDADARYRPLFADTTVNIGMSYYYRVRAQNATGISEPSPTAGPVRATYRLLVDEMADSSRWYAHAGELRFLGFQDLVKAKEDANRVVGKSGDFIVYHLADSIATISIDLFATSSDSTTAIQILSGPEPGSMTTRAVRRDVFINFKNEYGFYTPMTFSCTGIPAKDRFVRVMLADNTQVARIEIASANIGGLLLLRPGGRP